MIGGVGLEAAAEEGDGFGTGGVGAGVGEELVGLVEGGLERGHGLGAKGGEGLAARGEGIEQAGEDGEFTGGDLCVAGKVVQYGGKGFLLTAGGGELQKVIGEVGGRAAFLREDLLEHRGGVWCGRAFHSELQVGIVRMLHSEVHEAFADGRAFAAAEGEGKLPQHARVLVGEALDGEVFVAAFAEAHGVSAHGCVVVAEGGLEGGICQRAQTGERVQGVDTRLRANLRAQQIGGH